MKLCEIPIKDKNNNLFIVGGATKAQPTYVCIRKRESFLFEKKYVLDVGGTLVVR